MYPKTYQAYSVIPWSTELIQVVEKFVLPQERKSKNCDGKTPLQIFIEEHKELMAYEGQWMMGKATSCTVAASYHSSRREHIFAISDGLALVSALSTVLSLSIFTSRYPAIDYLYALPMRIIIGLLVLFLSLITMMTV
ncbi:hypothetical protein HYC85_025844 [Camellia sinensis]|uniref:PGG domain-containing protein n=1 Tax=Camellia sinensis TaxID=4442 RepID=A0A7J7G319_CAMSI|nr:hypothetical protein HYC85_025844 [Camellia sinensis]